MKTLILILLLMSSCSDNGEPPKVPIMIHCISLKPPSPYVGGSICKETIEEIVSCHRGWGHSSWVVPCSMYEAAKAKQKKLQGDYE